MKITLSGATLVAALVSALSAPPASATDSVYTDISGRDCKEIVYDEEMATSQMRCPGVAGFSLDVHDSDNRMTIDVLTPDGKSHPLDYWRVITPFFCTLGDKAEWRLNAQGRPIALIVRVNASDPEVETRTTSYLAVAKITPEKICVTARIAPSAKANEEARIAADAAAKAPCFELPESP